MKVAPYQGAGPVRVWLVVVAVMVYAMILVGGATRLTDSGLSITEWRPLLGAFPPMGEADWQVAFDKYRSMTAQFREVNPDMTMAGFREIYWWEWWHRQLGRIIGVVFAVPFVFFLVVGRISGGLRPHLFILLALGGLQGAIGWWMVASGVNTDLVSVAPYRLMTHFSLALLIIGYCTWLWMRLGRSNEIPSPRARGWSAVLIVMTGLQMALGALVAGLDAGRGYTDWPLMSGRFIPEALFALEPLWRNFAENEATAQFFHRMTAYALLAAALAAALRVKTADYAVFAIAVFAQGVIGVITLVLAAPVHVALLHQGAGVVVFLIAVRLTVVGGLFDAGDRTSDLRRVDKGAASL
jgi:cytochrome c oxidase assembly protein subunit 15